MKTRILAAAIGGVLVLGLTAGVGSNAATGSAVGRSPDPAVDASRKHMSESAMYSCVGTNRIVNNWFDTPNHYRVRMSGQFPRSIAAGTHKSVKSFRARATMPKALARKIRNDLGAKRVRIVQSDARLAVGANGKIHTLSANLRRSGWKWLSPIRRIHFGMRGRPVVGAPSSASRLKVFMPRHFPMEQKYRPPLTGSVKKPLRWKCKVHKNVSRKDRLIGTIKVR